MGNVLSGPPPTINIAEVPNMVLKDTLGAILDPRRCGTVNTDRIKALGQASSPQEDAQSGPFRHH